MFASGSTYEESAGRRSGWSRILAWLSTWSPRTYSSAGRNIPLGSGLAGLASVTSRRHRRK